MIGAILASLGTLRSAFKLRIALIASHHWSTVCRAAGSDQPSGLRPGRDADALRRPLAARAARARGARPFKPCQTCSVTNGMIGWSKPAEPVEQRRQHALGDRTGSPGRAAGP